MTDVVNHPKHYTKHPSGVECIQITEHMNFNLGNAVKYIWRADLKSDAEEDLKKAVWYIERELQRRGTEKLGAPKGEAREDRVGGYGPHKVASDGKPVWWNEHFTQWCVGNSSQYGKFDTLDEVVAKFGEVVKTL